MSPTCPADEDSAMQAALIWHLLDQHPATLSEDDLVRELGGPGDVAHRDAVERAIRELAEIGLIEQKNRAVLPTREAVHHHELTAFMAGL